MHANNSTDNTAPDLPTPDVAVGDQVDGTNIPTTATAPEEPFVRDENGVPLLRTDTQHHDLDYADMYWSAAAREYARLEYPKEVADRVDACLLGLDLDHFIAEAAELPLEELMSLGAALERGDVAAFPAITGLLVANLRKDAEHGINVSTDADPRALFAHASLVELLLSNEDSLAPEAAVLAARAAVYNAEVDEAMARMSLKAARGFLTQARQALRDAKAGKPRGEKVRLFVHDEWGPTSSDELVNPPAPGVDEEE